MTRQYKGMQEELLNRINQLEGTIQVRTVCSCRENGMPIYFSPCLVRELLTSVTLNRLWDFQYVVFRDYFFFYIKQTAAPYHNGTAQKHKKTIRTPRGDSSYKLCDQFLVGLLGVSRRTLLKLLSTFTVGPLLRRYERDTDDVNISQLDEEFVIGFKHVQKLFSLYGQLSRSKVERSVRRCARILKSKTLQRC